MRLDQGAYAAALHAAARGRGQGRCEELLGSMRDEGLRPDAACRGPKEWTRKRDRDEI